MTDSVPASLPWIEKLVAVDTTSRDSNLPLIDVVVEELRRHGVEPHLFPTPDGDKANLVATIPAADGGTTGGVVISGHTDVVPVDDQDWTSDPFTATVREGRLYGRGTCDMKGYIGVALHTLPQMLDAELAEPIHLALTYDEEPGCIGGDQIVKQIADLGLSPRIAIVGEPTMMEVVHGHKSMTTARATFTGVAAHSSLTPDGVNAIEHAARFITRVRDLADSWRTDGPFDDAFLLPFSTGGVNIVHGGIAGNTVPDRCVAQLEFRTIGAVDPEGIVERMRGWIADIDEAMKQENPRAGAAFEVLTVVPGLDTAPDSPAVSLAAELGGTPTDVKVTYGTEAGQFAGSGIETVVCGPGDIAQAHAADEYVELAQIEACEAFMATLVERLSRS